MASMRSIESLCEIFWSPIIGSGANGSSNKEETEVRGGALRTALYPNAVTEIVRRLR